eukprot:Gb_28706 [translate_table: standard]
MASSSRTEIEKFNGTGYELWKLKMEDLLEERDQWVAVKNEIKPTGILDEHWIKIDKKARGTIRLCLSDSVLLNVSNEATAYNGSMTTNPKMDALVASLLSEEMRRKSMDDNCKDALYVWGRSKEKGGDKKRWGGSKSKGRSKTPEEWLQIDQRKLGAGKGHKVEQHDGHEEEGEGSEESSVEEQSEQLVTPLRRSTRQRKPIDRHSSNIVSPLFIVFPGHGYERRRRCSSDKMTRGSSKNYNATRALDIQMKNTYRSYAVVENSDILLQKHGNGGSSPDFNAAAAYFIQGTYLDRKAILTTTIGYLGRSTCTLIKVFAPRPRSHTYGGCGIPRSRVIYANAAGYLDQGISSPLLNASIGVTHPWRLRFCQRPRSRCPVTSPNSCRSRGGSSPAFNVVASSPVPGASSFKLEHVLIQHSPPGERNSCHGVEFSRALLRSFYSPHPSPVCRAWGGEQNKALGTGEGALAGKGAGVRGAAGEGAGDGAVGGTTPSGGRRRGVTDGGKSDSPWQFFATGAD